jgi:AcrR family transcriptional regulator
VPMAVSTPASTGGMRGLKNLRPKAAGVGAGTLYRRFPSRKSLVLGVYRKEIDTLVALAPVLLARHPPLQAFRIWCDRLAKFGRMKYGVADIVHAATSDQDIQETYRPMLGLSAS